MRAFSFFATTNKGLEGVLADEVAALGGKRIEPAAGGVSFRGDRALLYRANLRLRVANRVLLVLAEFPAPSAEPLYEGTKRLPWPDHFSVRRRISVDATVRASGITHGGFAALKVKDAIVDRFRETVGRRPDVDPRAPDVRVVVRILDDRCTLSLDTSGESLNRRGYRTDPGEASLRETLAAGLVLLTGWDRSRPLADPTCGAGTIPIEAALIATNTAPGLLRSAFGFMNLSGHDDNLWKSLVDEARAAVLRPGLPRIAGSDRDEAAIRAARKNAANAGLEERVAFTVTDIRDFSPGDEPGIILCNPPYGARMTAGPEPEAFYRALGEAFKKRCRGWTAYVLSGNPDVTRHIGLKASRRIPVMNGPIDCRLLEYPLY